MKQLWKLGLGFAVYLAFCACESGQGSLLQPYFYHQSRATLEVTGVVQGQKMSTRETLTVTCTGTAGPEEWPQSLEVYVDGVRVVNQTCNAEQPTCSTTIRIKGSGMQVGDHEYRAIFFTAAVNMEGESFGVREVKVPFEVYKAPAATRDSHDHELDEDSIEDGC